MSDIKQELELWLGEFASDALSKVDEVAESCGYQVFDLLGEDVTPTQFKKS